MPQSDLRVKWIDIAKAITIVLVVFGHTMRGGIAQQVVYSFHVASFFFLSGMTVKTDNIKGRILNDVIKIMVPYYCFGIISILIYLILGNFAATKFDMEINTSLLDNILSLLYATAKGGKLQFNTPLWFLPCLLVTKLTYYVFARLFRGRLMYVLVASIVTALGGYLYTSMSLPYLPFSFVISVKMLPFFVLGQVFLRSLCASGMQIDKKGRSIFLGCGLLAATCIIGAYFPKVNYSGDTFPNILAFCASASLGSVGISLLSMGISSSRSLEYIGKNTLAILVMHKFPVLLFQTWGPFSALLQEVDSFKGNVCGGIPVVIISVGMCLIAEIIISKFFPFLLGKWYVR